MSEQVLKALIAEVHALRARLAALEGSEYVARAGSLTSGDAGDGQVLTADGAGGSAWEDAAGSGDVTWATIQTSQLVNEFKGFPSVAGIDIDLDAANLWWDTEGSPSSGPTMVDVAGEGITETYEYALKQPTDASGDGLSQTWTFADEPRVKAVRTFSVEVAIWCVSGLGVTASLVNSDASETVASEVTAAAWTIVKLEAHALAGTTCKFKAIADGAGTFYVVPLGACIGAKAVPLGPRPEVFVEKFAVIVNAADPGGAFVDVDVTANTEPLATAVRVQGYYKCSATLIDLLFRRNGDSVTVGVFRNWAANTYYAFPQTTVYLDDANVFEYGTTAPAGDTEAALIYLTGYWRWG